MINKAVLLILLLLFGGLIILFVPIPSIFRESAQCQPCAPGLLPSQCPKCPQKGDIEWRPSIAKMYWNRLFRYVPMGERVQTAIPANWKMYTDSDFGFSLQYPPAWGLTTDFKPEGAQFINEQPVVLIHDNQLRPDPDVGPNSTYPSHYVGISTLASSKTLQEFLDSMILDFSPEIQEDTREFMDQKTLIINGVPAVSFNEPGMGGRGKMITVSNGKYIILFSFPYQSDYLKDSIFTQILSTFKFVE